MENLTDIVNTLGGQETNNNNLNKEDGQNRELKIPILKDQTKDDTQAESENADNTKDTELSTEENLNDQQKLFQIRPPSTPESNSAPRSFLNNQNSQNDNSSPDNETTDSVQEILDSSLPLMNQNLNLDNHSDDVNKDDNKDSNNNNDGNDGNAGNDEIIINNDLLNKLDLNDSTSNEKDDRNVADSNDPKKTKNLNELSIDELKQMAFESQPILGLEISKYQDLINNLIDEQIEIGDNVTTDKYEMAIQHVRNFELVQQKINLQQDALANYQIEINSFNQELANYDSRTNQELNALQDNINKKRTQMLNKHELELDQHAEKWQSRNMIKLYNSASSKLLFLRKQLNNLRATGRYKEAHDLKLIVEKQETYESNEAIKKMQRDFDESLKKIHRKQKREIGFFEEDSSIKIETYKQDRARKRQALLNKKVKLENKGQIISDPEKLWNLNQMQRADQNFGSTRTDIKSRSCPASARPTTMTLCENHLLEDAKTKEKNGPQTTIKLPPLNTRRKVTKA